MHDRPNRQQARARATTAPTLTSRQAAAEAMPYLEVAIPIGLVGASTVAAFVLLLDLIAGQALATPNALGAAVFRGEAFDLGTPITAIDVVSYTLLHTALFIVAATGAITVEYTLTERGVPLVTQCLGGAALLFAVLHATILTMMLLVDAPLDTTLGPARLLAINAVAAAAMATATYFVARRRLARRDDD
ncbi:MAG: hypothetical protein AAGC67_15625 [Myxococcota bacterium]